MAALPENVDFNVAAAIEFVGVTAFEGVIDVGELEVGERCLVHGGSGGGGHVAVQLAVAAGATVSATTSEQYNDRVLGLAANTVLDYSRDEEDLVEDVRSIGFPDVILDHRVEEHLGLDTEVGANGCRIVAIDSTEVRT